MFEVLDIALCFFEPIEEVVFFLIELFLFFEGGGLDLDGFIALEGLGYENAFVELEGSAVFLEFALAVADSIDEEDHEGWGLEEDVFCLCSYCFSLSFLRFTLGVVKSLI